MELEICYQKLATALQAFAQPMSDAQEEVLRSAMVVVVVVLGLAGRKQRRADS